MAIVLSIIAGGFFSGAFVAPRPFCYYCLTVSTLLVAIARSL
jgi:hypothetical protein